MVYGNLIKYKIPEATFYVLEGEYIYIYIYRIIGI